MSDAKDSRKLKPITGRALDQFVGLSNDGLKDSKSRHRYQELRSLVALDGPRRRSRAVRSQGEVIA